MSRKIVYLFILIIGLFSSVTVFAQTEITPLTSCSEGISSGCYTLLEPLGNIEGITIGSNAAGYSGIGGFINFLFQIGIGIAGILGVVMLIIYGFQYMSNEQSIKNFTELKEKITNVILGLLLLLGTFVLLNTINPDLLMIDPRIKGVSLEFDEQAAEGDPENSSLGYGSGGAGTTQFVLPEGFGIFCPLPSSPNASYIPKIVESFIGKTTYRYGGKGGSGNFSGKDTGNTCPTNTICLDCSGFVNHVYRCAGIPSPGGGTSAMFSRAEKIQTFVYNGPEVLINGKSLKVGDIIGSQNWHVFIYIGNGKFADQTADNKGRNTGKGLTIGDARRVESAMKRRQLLVKRLP